VRAEEEMDPIRKVGRILGAMGFLLPVLAGGNNFAGLQPDDGVAVFDLVAVLVAGVMARDTRAAGVRGGGRSSTWWAAAYLLILLLLWAGALFLRPRGPRAVLEARGIFAAAVLFASLSSHPLRLETLWSFSRGLLLGSLVTTLYGQYQYWIAFPRTLPLLTAAGIPGVALVNANFYNANCYAAFLSATILLDIGLAVTPDGSWRLIARACLLPLVGTLLLTESRSAVALLVLAGLAWGALRLEPSKRHAMQRSLIWSGLLVASGMLVVTVATVDFHELWRFGLLGRLSIWQGSLAMIREHWVFGVGLGRFWDYFPHYQVTDYYTRYPHSFLLEILAELGIAGGTAVVGFLAAAAVAPMKSIVRLRGEVCRGRLGACIALAVASAVLVAHALVDIDWHAPANPILLFVLLGFAQHTPLWMSR
jgi:O-antigen ligase